MPQILVVPLQIVSDITLIKFRLPQLLFRQLIKPIRARTVDFIQNIQELSILTDKNNIYLHFQVLISVEEQLAFIASIEIVQVVESLEPVELQIDHVGVDVDSVFLQRRVDANLIHAVSLLDGVLLGAEVSQIFVGVV